MDQTRETAQGVAAGDSPAQALIQDAPRWMKMTALASAAASVLALAGVASAAAADATRDEASAAHATMAHARMSHAPANHDRPRAHVEAHAAGQDHSRHEPHGRSEGSVEPKGRRMHAEACRLMRGRDEMRQFYSHGRREGSRGMMCKESQEPQERAQHMGRRYGDSAWRYAG